MLKYTDAELQAIIYWIGTNVYYLFHEWQQTKNCFALIGALNIKYVSKFQRMVALPEILIDRNILYAKHGWTYLKVERKKEF